MKKFTTTFFLLMAMVLLLPTEVKATDYYLIGDFNNWSTTDTSYKFTVNGNTATAQISAAAFSKNGTDNDGVYFVVNAIESSSSRWYLRPSENTEITEGSQYSIALLNNSTNNSFCFKNPATSSTEIYTITLDFSSSNDINNSILTITKSGSGGGETGTGYYLYYGTGGNWSSASTYCVNSDNELKSVDGKYNVTFTIPSASTSKFYFCVFNGEMKSDWSNAIRPNSGSGTDDNNTATSGSIANSSNKVWLYETASTEDVSLTLSLAGVANGAGWTLTKGEIIPTVTYTLRYGGKEVTGKQTDNGITFPIPASAYSSGLSFTISDSEGNTYNPSSNTTLSNGEPSSYADNGTGSWTCSEQANANGYTVTLDTDARTVNMAWSTSVIIPSLSKDLYLVGDFLATNNNIIDYDSKRFKLTDNGDGTYYIDLPTTLVVKYQLLYSNGSTTKLYGPNGSGYAVNVSSPANEGFIEGNLYEATKAPSNYWSQSSRVSTDKSEGGMYRITITMGTDGQPSTWEITHDPLTRVAYYLPDMPNAALQPSYVKRADKNSSFNDVYFGYVYLPAGVGCYVVSNVCGFYNDNLGLLKTKDKLYLQGTQSGENPGTIAYGDERNKYTKVYPIASGETRPFIFNNTKNMMMLLEYAGRGDSRYAYDDIYGEILESNSKPSSETGGSELPEEFTSMKILGPAVKGDGWDTVSNAIEMTYNPGENCWEATFETTKPVGDKFRFIANDNWKYSWEENGTAAEEIAKIPYDDTTLSGQPATVAEPNKIALVNQTTTTSAETRTVENDIIFNRVPGIWTVKFYIDVTGTSGNYKYDFKYTINGTPTVNVPVDLTYRVNKFIRSFSYGDNLDLPADGSVKAYEAYRFVQGDKATKKHGTVYLRRIEYIPANMGVILVGEVPEGSGTFEDGNVKAFNLTKRTAGLVDKNEDLWTLKDSYKNDANWSEWNNYLVGTVTAVNDLGNAEVVDGKVTKRYFGLGHYYATNEYKKTGVGDDYIGFFRYTANAISGANKAYLSIPTAKDSKFGYIDFNGQWLDDNYDSPNDEISTLSKAGIIFDDIDLDETTAISNVNANEKNVNDGAYYTLQGIKVAKPTRGLYIHNGKKVIIK